MILIGTDPEPFELGIRPNTVEPKLGKEEKK
jgi:hypothetical protein